MSGIALLLSLTATVLGVTAPETANQPLHTATFSASEKTIYHKLGDKTISHKVTKYGEAATTCCINVHDDEATAVQAARILLEQRGGLLIRIENSAQRMVSFPFKGVTYTFDPNRIFSSTGIKFTLKANGKINPLAVAEVEKFAARLLQLIPDSASCIIALHNNTKGNYSIKTYQPGGNRQKDALRVYADSWQDIDDITLTTDEKLFNKMSGFGYNSILQDNIKVTKDGSLSVYYGELNKRYINIETQFGKTTQYKEMLSKLLYVLDEERKPAKNETDIVDN